MGKIEILVPVAKVKFGEIKMAQRPLDLEKKFIGLMWNGKPNADLLLQNLRKSLEKIFPLSRTLMESKPLPTSAAPTEVLEGLSSKFDLVILAIAD
ncbi:hypothetical protein ACFL0M_13770 [Thermodesulfobacteriota bacterium]